VEDTRVIILAGGKGTRLKPYTTVFPKPLMPIGDMPILEVVLRQLCRYGFKKVTLSVNHLKELIETFFGDGEKIGLSIDYCVEDKPLGTAGSISLVKDVTENVLVMNGDLLTTLNYANLMSHHIKSGAAATIGVFPRKVKIDFGVLDLDDNGDLVEYREKPVLEYVVSMGVNALSCKAMEFIKPGQYLDMPNLMMSLKKAGLKVTTYSENCEWLDIGRPDDYEAAINLFNETKNKYL
jgi:NDP-sugar pyrophosphorylase family protein